VLPAIEAHPDSVFMEDTAVVLDEVLVLTRPTRSREAEPAHLLSDAGDLGRTVARITAPGTLDGGDVLRFNGTPLDALGQPMGGINGLGSFGGGGVVDNRQSVGGGVVDNRAGGGVVDNRASAGRDDRDAVDQDRDPFGDKGAGGLRPEGPCRCGRCGKAGGSQGKDGVLTNGDVPEQDADDLCGKQTDWVFDRTPVARTKNAAPKPQASAVEAAVQRFLYSAAPTILGGIRTSGIDFNTEALIDLFVSNMTKPLEEVFRRGHQYESLTVAQAAGQAPGPFMAPAFDAARFAERYVPRIAQSVVDTIETRLQSVHADTISRIIADGTRTGATIPELTNSLATELRGLSESSAERIARTESARAYVAGREQAWTDSGIEAKKRWMLSGNPCWICRYVASLGPVPIGEPFVKIGTTITGPGGKTYTFDYANVNGGDAHPNDACDIGMEYKA
jgi:hypothetical protein